jgi:hypothetical protein
MIDVRRIVYESSGKASTVAFFKGICWPPASNRDTQPVPKSVADFLKETARPSVMLDERNRNERNVMTATKEFRTLRISTQSTARFALNRRVSLPPRTLEQTIHAAVSEEFHSSESCEVGSRAERLLALITHCYARQVYNSHQVATLAARDPRFTSFSPNALPNVQTIRRFRSEHRDALHRCLTAALHFLAEQKIALGLLTRFNAAQLAEEANRRIIMAAFEDSLELDSTPAVDSPVEFSYLFARNRARMH